MARERDILDASVTALGDRVASMSPGELGASAYPAGWSVADVCSHLGSSAEIFTNSIDVALGGAELPPQPIWDAWNAKEPEEQAADFRRADRALVDRLDALTADERENFAFKMGPLDLDFTTFVRLRINEHTLHRWDIEVARDPQAALSADAVPLILEQVPMIAGWAARPRATANRAEYSVRTTAPDARFVCTIAPNEVHLVATEASAEPADIVLPAEALIRLVYGRLDVAHTPPFEGDGAILDEICAMFPGL